MSTTEIRIDTLAEGSNAVALEVPRAELGITEGDEITLAGDGVRVDLEVVKVGETLDLRGRIHGTAVTVCARCAGEARVELDVPFRLVAKEQEDDEAVVDDEDLVYYEGKVLDLADALRQLVLVSVPMAPLCREACRGLCPVCGADLNVETCECDLRTPDPRWRAIDELLERERNE